MVYWLAKAERMPSFGQMMFSLSHFWWHLRREDRRVCTVNTCRTRIGPGVCCRHLAEVSGQFYTGGPFVTSLEVRTSQFSKVKRPACRHIVRDWGGLKCCVAVPSLDNQSSLAIQVMPGLLSEASHHLPLNADPDVHHLALQSYSPYLKCFYILLLVL